MARLTGEGPRQASAQRDAGGHTVGVLTQAVLYPQGKVTTRERPG